MPAVAKAAFHTALAVFSCTALSLNAPSAQAADFTIAGVHVSAAADQKTRDVAASNPEALQATATVCGTGYVLLNAQRLPTDTNRLGTLFIYNDGGSGPDNFACAILDNNTGSTKWMKVQLCENKVSSPRCDADSGNYSQYAGPVYMDNCATVTALMKNTSSSTTYLINRVEGSFCD
jgi:hypothetical protein